MTKRDKRQNRSSLLKSLTCVVLLPFLLAFGFVGSLEIFSPADATQSAPHPHTDKAREALCGSGSPVDHCLHATAATADTQEIALVAALLTVRISPLELKPSKATPFRHYALRAPPRLPAEI